MEASPQGVVIRAAQRGRRAARSPRSTTRASPIGSRPSRPSRVSPRISGPGWSGASNCRCWSPSATVRSPVGRTSASGTSAAATPASASTRSTSIARARGKGLGRLLLEATCDEWQRRGNWKLVGLLFASNAPSIALARSCGFREVGTHAPPRPARGRVEGHGRVRAADGRGRKLMLRASERQAARREVIRQLDPAELSRVERMPKVELHLHLEGSIRPATMLHAGRTARRRSRRRRRGRAARALRVRELRPVREAVHAGAVGAEHGRGLRAGDRAARRRAARSERAARRDHDHALEPSAPGRARRPTTRRRSTPVARRRPPAACRSSGSATSRAASRTRPTS